LVLVENALEERLAAVLAEHDALFSICESADAVDVSVAGIELGNRRRVRGVGR
jgi:hypothetical protein